MGQTTIDPPTKTRHNHRMNYGDYIWQSPHWPEWQYELHTLAGMVSGHAIESSGTGPRKPGQGSVQGKILAENSPYSP